MGVKEGGFRGGVNFGPEAQNLHVTQELFFNSVTNNVVSLVP